MSTLVVKPVSYTHTYVVITTDDGGNFTSVKGTADDYATAQRIAQGDGTILNVTCPQHNALIDDINKKCSTEYGAWELTGDYYFHKQSGSRVAIDVCSRFRAAGWDIPLDVVYKVLHKCTLPKRVNRVYTGDATVENVGAIVYDTLTRKFTDYFKVSA